MYTQLSNLPHEFHFAQQNLPVVTCREHLLRTDSYNLKLSVSEGQTCNSSEQPKDSDTLPAPKQIPSAGRRHKRTATPEQRLYYGMAPIRTAGILPQEDRELVADFIGAIQLWATKYVADLGSLCLEDLKALSQHSAIAEFLKGSGDILPLVSAKEMRAALVAAIVTRDVVYYSMSEHFLFNSSHPRAYECDELFTEFHLLPEDAYAAKKLVLFKQQALYSSIENDKSSYRAWRSEASDKLAVRLINKLSFLTTNKLWRDHELSELFVKGYRIGFRMRMAPSKWEMCWPDVGSDFNGRYMVNEDKYLYGSTTETYLRLTKFPTAHRVRFAMSPTIFKSDFSMTGGESKELVHSALVHISRKGSFVGAERASATVQH